MQFTQWNVMIDIGFWTRLAKKKIEEYRLKASAQPLIAKYRLSNRPEKISILSVDAFSFEEANEDQQGPVDFKVRGTFFNTNTIEEFKAIEPPAKESTYALTQENYWPSSSATSRDTPTEKPFPTSTKCTCSFSQT